MNQQFIELTLTINIVQYYNMQLINKLFNSIWPLFLNLCLYWYIFMRYIIHLYSVLGNCTQVHLKCTWVLPKNISQNPVLVLVRTWTILMYLYPSTVSMYLPQPCSRHRIRSTLTLGHGGCPQYSIFTIEQGGNILFLWNLNARAGDESAISDFPSRHQDPPPHTRPSVLLLHIYKHITRGFNIGSPSGLPNIFHILFCTTY